MASKRRQGKTVLNPKSLCTNEEVALRNRGSFLFDEFNLCAASLRHRLTETKQHFRIFTESRQFQSTDAFHP